MNETDGFFNLRVRVGSLQEDEFLAPSHALARVCLSTLQNLSSHQVRADFFFAAAIFLIK